MGKVLGWILGIGTLVGALWLLWSKKNKVTDWSDALEAQQLKQQIAKDQATLAEMLVKDEIRLEEIGAIEALIAESKTKAAAILTDTDLEGKSSDEIARAWSAAGF